MKTFEEQQAFFDRHWEAMRTAAEEGGGAAVLAFIEGFPEGLERRVLHLFARQGLVMREWEGRNLDVVAEVARGSIDALLAEGEAAEDEGARRRAKELANVISYNLSADLADCWPGEGPPRERAHFQAGLRAAEDCIRWREELEKGPGALSGAWWAKGMHQLSLGDAAGAKESWETSLDFARQAAEEEQDFGVVLGRGYLGLAEWRAGDDAGRARFREAMQVFASQLFDDERKADARFGIDQLETVSVRYGPQPSPR